MRGIGLGGAEGAGFEGVAELVEGGEGFRVAGGGGALGEEVELVAARIAALNLITVEAAARALNEIRDAPR